MFFRPFNGCLLWFWFSNWFCLNYVAKIWRQPLDGWASVLKREEKKMCVCEREREANFHSNWHSRLSITFFHDSIEASSTIHFIHKDHYYLCKSRLTTVSENRTKPDHFGWKKIIFFSPMATSKLVFRTSHCGKIFPARAQRLYLIHTINRADNWTHYSIIIINFSGKRRIF